MIPPTPARSRRAAGSSPRCTTGETSPGTKSPRRSRSSPPGSPSAGWAPGGGSSRSRPPSPRRGSRSTRWPRPWSLRPGSRPTRSRSATRAAASALRSSSRTGADCQVRVEHGELVRQRGNEETREPLPERGPRRRNRARGVLRPGLFGPRAAPGRRVRGGSLPGPALAGALRPRHRARLRGAAGRARTSGPRPATTTTTSPTSTSGPGRRDVSGVLWNATASSGAELTYSELIAAEDHRQAALDFMRERYRALQDA